MSDGKQEQMPEEERSSRMLFFVILGMIVGLFLSFVLLRPRGPDAAPPRASSANHADKS